jgi:hypothetical protein
MCQIREARGRGQWPRAGGLGLGENLGKSCQGVEIHVNSRHWGKGKANFEGRGHV